MRSLRSLLGAAIAAAALAAPAPALAGTWDEIRNSIYGTKPIEDGRAVMKLSAPYRPDDMRRVPIGIEAAFLDGRTINTVTFVIDENPTPVVAVFHMGKGRERLAISSDFRVDRQSDVRVVIEASDGKLYMVGQLVKFAGGQASCSAPPQGDPKEIAASMGKMQFAQLGTDKATPVLARGRIEVSHPNHTGMVLDQQTLYYIPMKMVSEIDVMQAGDVVFRMQGSIGLSQNPAITFDFRRPGTSAIDVSVKDTDGGAWTHSFPVGPQS